MNYFTKKKIKLNVNFSFFLKFKVESPVDKQRHRDSYQGFIFNIRPFEGKLMIDKVSPVS